MNEEIEVWKDVVEWKEFYQVSNLGRIKSLCRSIIKGNNVPYVSSEKILKNTPNEKGYLRVTLIDRERISCTPVHRIVAMAFIPNPENKPHVNHKNGIKNDNRVENLEWVTISENKIHAIALGLVVMKKGEQHYKATLKNEDVLRIRELLSKKSSAELSKIFSVGVNIIDDIKNKRTWKSVI